MEITSFAGTTVNGSTGIVVRYGYGNWAPNQATTQFRDRVNLPPEFLSVSYPVKQQGFEVHIGDAYSGTTDAFMLMVSELFDVRAGEQTLIMQRVAGDSSTEMQIRARVVSFGRVHNSQWRGTFEIADPFWLSTTESTATNSPATNGGRVAVTPKIVLSGGLSATRNRATITDRTGSGLANYPVRIPYTSGRAAANIVVYVSGLNAPFWYDSTSGALWVRVNCGPNGSTYVDIYYSTNLNNTKTANTLDMAGLDPATATNDAPVWNDLIVGKHPQAASLAWLPGNIPPWMTPVTGASSAVTTISYGLGSGPADPSLGGTYDNTASQITFYYVAGQGGPDNDQHCIILTTPVPFAATNSLVNLTRASSQVVNSIGPSMVVAYRTQTDGAWIYAEGISLDQGTLQNNLISQTLMGALALPGAVQVAIGLRVTHLQQLGTEPAGNVRLTAAGAGGTFTGALDSSKTPTVSLSADITAQIIDGTLLNSTTGDMIVFDTLLADAGDFTLDRDAGSIGPASGPWYAANIEFNNAAQWFTLAVGSNSWSYDAGAVSLAWHERTAF